MKSERRNNTGRSMKAGPAWPAALRLDGADDASRSSRTSRSHSIIRSSLAQSNKRSDSPGPSTIPTNPFTKIIIKTREEGYESIIIDEIELRNLPSEVSQCDFSDSNSDLTHGYIATNTQAYAGYPRVNLRGGSGTGDMRTGAIISFKQTEERWKPTWSGAKSLFSSRRRESEPAERTMGQSILGSSNLSDNTCPSLHHGDRSLLKSSTTTSRRSKRQANTSATEFSFPTSEGSDSEIPRFATMKRIKQKLRPLIHSVSRQSLRDRFSSIGHSGSQSIEELDSDGLSYSGTVKKALGVACHSGSVRFARFTLPDPARDDPELSAAKPVSVMANYASSNCSDTASESTIRARTPVKTLLGVKTDKGTGSGSSCRSRSSREVTGPSVGHPVDIRVEVDMAATMAFQHARKERDRISRKETDRDLMSSNSIVESEEKKDEKCKKDEDQCSVESPRDDDTKQSSSYATCRSIASTISTYSERSSEVLEAEQAAEQVQLLVVPAPSNIEPARRGNVNRSRNRGQTMSNHFHSRRTRTGTDSTDGSETFVSENRERLKGRLGLLMMRGANGGDKGGEGAGKVGKVEFVSMNLGGDY